MKKPVVRLLEQAREEILRLRRENELLTARVETMELFDRVLRSRLPQLDVGYAEDVAWSIKKMIGVLEGKPIDIEKEEPDADGTDEEGRADEGRPVEPG